MEFIEPYKLTILVMGLAGLIFLIQLAIVDVVGIKTKHTPGHPILADHKDFYFRASRALANSNESAAIFILLVAFSILSMANPEWLGISATVYLVGRIAHMFCYYLNLKLCRSIAFAISFVGLAGMLVVGLVSWIEWFL